ncbi:MAG: response regulator [Gammaproteobacteria bacterium]
MSFKRALVVDDSKSARRVLGSLLEKHNLMVESAASAEEALDLLKRQPVDVIFMDHTMPGMDGLEAVSAIKKNPRTAMIPVMMYTAKEGEVYVGQARALGAVGVLPKQVRPAELFEVLLNLGLVTNRRSKKRPASPGLTVPTPVEDSAEIDPDHAEHVQGIAVQALVTRILQDQHIELRSDILSSQREFARRVAGEIFDKQEAERQLAEARAEATRPWRPGPWLLLILALLPAVIFFALFRQATTERDEALAANARLAVAVDQARLTAESQQSDLLSGLALERSEADTRYLELINVLEWAVNQRSFFPLDEVAMDDTRLETLQELLARLAAIGFEGTVRLDAHLGEFCLVGDEAGGFQLADPDLPLEDCSMLGHPLDNSVALGERQSVSFANFLASSPLVNQSGIEVEVVAHSRIDSVRRYPFPANLRTAGEWNEIAELNNRLQFSLLPATP